MKKYDCVSTLYERLLASNEYQHYIEWLESFKKNLETKDYDSLYPILKTHAIQDIRKRIDSILEDIVKELIGHNPKTEILTSYWRVSVYYRNMPDYEYKKNCWASPPLGIIRVDFREKKITVFDGKQEFEKATRIEQENIAREKEKLQKMQQETITDEDPEASVKHILKEIRSKKPFEFLEIAARVRFIPGEAQRLKEICSSIMKKRQELYKLQQEKIQMMSSKNFMGIYEEIRRLQAEFLEKLKPLGFEVVTEQIVRDDREDLDDDL